MAHLVDDGRQLRLERWPPGAADRLQAWDAADEYLLRRLEASATAPGSSLLLAGDRWGALAVALAARGLRPVSWGDSHLGRLALAANLRANGLDANAVPFTGADRPPPGPHDLALLRLPKDLVCLEDTLGRLRGALAPGARLIAGGMIKHTPTRAWRLLEGLVGATVTTPGWKKARLGTSQLEAREVPAPTSGRTYRPLPQLELAGAPGVFGGGRLDGGSALLLRHLPAGQAALAAADLGCGDGVLALALAWRCPQARVLGVDESYRAVACAEANLARNEAALGGEQGRVRFAAADGLADAAPGSLDLVVCNPPFHQGHAVADVAAERLFAQAFAALRPGGRLLAVGNRHLGHHAKLDRLFGDHDLLDGDARFVVVGATRVR
jgi:16S rRNA (guanine1207-N2)-methyltransferase